MPTFWQSSCGGEPALKIVIVGAGEVGFHIAQRLVLERKEVVIIDKDEQALARVKEHLDAQIILGSGSNPKILEQAGIREAEILLAVTNSDEANLIVCVFANLLAPRIQKIVRIRNEEYNEYREALAKDILNISMVTNPDMEVINSMLRLMTAPDVEEVSDFAGGRIRLVKKQLPEFSPLNGMRLEHLPKLLHDIPIVIGAIIRQDRLIIPKGTDTLKAGDSIYFVCEKDNLAKISKLFGTEPHPIRNILIMGGGKIGLQLAKALDNLHYNTKVVELDPHRSEVLSANLHRTIVLQGDGTDLDLLEQENISSMDLVIAVTGDEELNILFCLLAKRLGAHKTLARINKFAYLSLVQAIGIDHIVSTRMSAVNSILHFIRRGKIISTVSIAGEEAEAIEAIALENSAIVGKPLKKLNFPKEAIILCVLRGDEVIIPSGESVIHPQDRLIIMATRRHIPLVEQSLMVKLDHEIPLTPARSLQADWEIP
ncbi:MAG: Trk system potassium transporter TrkA [Desulfobacterales bacterium]|nr:Trk system potassium transporter TrkA [Desulfobacterales bacterium]